MKKFILGLIAGVGIVLMVMYCSTSSHQSSPQKSQKNEMITWEKLDTFVFDYPAYKVEYPDYFVVDTTELSTGCICFYHIIDGQKVSLRCFSCPNDERWDTKVAADSAAYYRITITNDSLTMRDMHKDYFFLEGVSKEKRYRFYEQYVVDKEQIYVLELVYSGGIPENKVKRLKELVHEWSPK